RNTLQKMQETVLTTRTQCSSIFLSWIIDGFTLPHHSHSQPDVSGDGQVAPLPDRLPESTQPTGHCRSTTTPPTIIVIIISTVIMIINIIVGVQTLMDLVLPKEERSTMHAQLVGVPALVNDPHTAEIFVRVVSQLLDSF